MSNSTDNLWPHRLPESNQATSRSWQQSKERSKVLSGEGNVHGRKFAQSHLKGWREGELMIEGPGCITDLK